MEIDTEDYASMLFRFGNGEKGALTVSQVSAGRKNRIYFELDGSRKSAAWDSETPNQLWIGRRDGNNEILMKDPSLFYPEARSLVTLPGGHNEGFNDTPVQLFGECYRDIRSGAPGPTPPYPTFADGLREILLCDCHLGEPGAAEVGRCREIVGQSGRTTRPRAQAGTEGKGKKERTTIAD